MSATRVMVVGSINADDAVRLARMPGLGETVTGRSITTALGGKGANQAVASARAGATVQFVGAVGASDGSPLVAALADDGIDVTSIAALDRVSTGRAIVLVDDDAENSIVVVPGANFAIADQAVEAACASLLPGDILLLQHEVPISTSRLAARTARTAGATVLWNAAPAPASADELIADLDLLIVNEHELAAVSSLLELDASQPLEVQLDAVGSALGADVVCTLGSAGATYRVDGAIGSAPAPRVDAVDTTAAGDTFVGYLAATTGQPFAERLKLALAAGSLAVTRSGAATSIPTRTEVESTLGATAPTERSRA